MPKFIPNLLRRWNFGTPESVSYGQRSKCADLLNSYMNNSIQLLTENEVEKQLQTAPYLRAVRLDVFAMDTEDMVYNTEMQNIWMSHWSM